MSKQVRQLVGWRALKSVGAMAIVGGMASLAHAGDAPPETAPALETSSDKSEDVLVFTPSASATARMKLWDTGARSNTSFETSDVRLGGHAQYGQWTLQVELEATGASDDGDDGHNRILVRQAHLERKFHNAAMGLGRFLPSTALDQGIYFSHYSVPDEYGSSDGVRLSYEHPFGSAESGDLIRAEFSFLNTLGATPVSDMQGGDNLLPDPANTAAGDASKSGSAWAGKLALGLKGVRFSLWYGHENTRIETAQTSAATPTAPDGVAHKRYDDLQTMLGYEAEDWEVHTGLRRIKQSASLKAMVEADGRVIKDEASSKGNAQEHRMIDVGGSYTWSRRGAASWILGFDAIMASQITDNMTKADQSIEDRYDTTLYALTQSYREGPIETSFSVHHAKAKGRVFSNSKGELNDRSARTTAFIRVSVDLSGVAVKRACCMKAAS